MIGDPARAVVETVETVEAVVEAPVVAGLGPRYGGMEGVRPIKAGDTGHTCPTGTVGATKGLLRALLLPAKGNKDGDAPFASPVKAGDEDTAAAGTNEKGCGAVAVKKGEDVRALSKGEGATVRPI
jgi:hypothetical protein